MNVKIEMIGGTNISFTGSTVKFEGAFVVVTKGEKVWAYPAANVTKVTAAPTPTPDEQEK